MKLRTLPDSYAVVRLQPGSELPEWVDRARSARSPAPTTRSLSSAATTTCPKARASTGAGRVLEVMGPLDFSLAGVVASLVVPLAGAELPIFVISTFESDYVLVRSSDLARAADILEDAGHVFAA